MTFRKDFGNWTKFRSLPGIVVTDFHWAGEGRTGSYSEDMYAVEARTIQALRQAQQEGREFVLFTHGWSTSRPGVTTSRSQVRKVMRSKAATPFIVRSACIQHYSVFVAAIRPRPTEETSGVKTPDHKGLCAAISTPNERHS